MNKQDLSKKWSKYCNTDKLVDDMMALLKMYKHRCSEHGVCTLLDKYFEQKEPLIKMFITSNNYIGDMRISLKKEFERQTSENEISSFFCNIHEKLDSKQILQYTDSDEKTFADYLMTGRKIVDIASMPSKTEQEEKTSHLARFSYYNLASIESNNKWNAFNDYMRFLGRMYTSKLSLEYQNSEDSKSPNLKPGTKTSRAFNTVCKYYGVDKLNPQSVITERDGETVQRTVYPYDKVFAQYSDLVSDLKRKMYFIISLNPLDYLTMSFGVSWISCHNIGTGGWKGGCLSYMLDTTSMITFVVDNIDEPIHQIPKLYRQMYHYENNLFIQNRLYPQGNDGATDLYEKFRGFVVEEFNELLNVDGEWGCSVGKDYVTRHVNSVGAHYRDYNSNRSCSIFYPKEHADEALNHTMTIGHTGICVDCGSEFTTGNSLYHPYRVDCFRF